MDAESLLENLGLVCTSPESIAKIRGLILSLAVKGKLTSQHAKDGNNEDLIQELTKDRVAFLKANSLKDRKVVAPTGAQNAPHDIPKNWTWVQLGSLCRAQAGFAFESSGFTQAKEKGIPLIRIRDIESNETQLNYLGDYRPEFIVKKGDFLVGMDGKFRISKWKGDEGLLNQRVSRLQWFSTSIEQSFFSIAAQHRLTELQGTKSYTTVDHLSTKQIEESAVPLPPLAEQKRIVAKVDELIALCDQLETQLKERDVKQAALAKAALAKFTEDPTPENLQLLFHPSFSIATEDLQGVVRSLAAGGRLIARTSSWNKEKLGSLCVKIGSGSTPTGGKESYQTSGTPLIRSMNVHFDGIHYEGLAFLNDSQAEKLKNVTVAKGDVLLNITGASIGRVTVAPERIAGARVNQHVCIIRTQAKLTPRFLALVLASPEIQSVINNVQVGATREALNKSMIQDFDIPMPSVEDQNLTTEKAAALLESCRLLEAQLEASRTTGEKLLEAMVAELTAA